ncbi:MAG TPA: hypothetical protein VL832_27250 [Puia sp.]|nr:hypothetical protein [Puia sp.]
MEKLLGGLLILHIIGGTVALLSGLFAITTQKGGKNHRLSGKFYFGGMTAVFISAVALSIGHHKPFLLMVGFFSYYMVVRGYRILYLKKLGKGQKPTGLDWAIVIIAGAFIVYLLCWGIVFVVWGVGMGIVAIVFGALGCLFLRNDLNKFIRGPKEKMHWWYTHIGGMGGGYIATLTAFVVVNIELKPGWILWLIPAAIGVPVILVTIARYKRKFSPASGDPGL